MRLNKDQKNKIKKVVYKVVGFAVLGVTGVVALALYNKINGRPLLEMKIPGNHDEDK